MRPRRTSGPHPSWVFPSQPVRSPRDPNSYSIKLFFYGSHCSPVLVTAPKGNRQRVFPTSFSSSGCGNTQGSGHLASSGAQTPLESRTRPSTLRGPGPPRGGLAGQQTRLAAFRGPASPRRTGAVPCAVHGCGQDARPRGVLEPSHGASLGREEHGSRALCSEAAVETEEALRPVRRALSGQVLLGSCPANCPQ